MQAASVGAGGKSNWNRMYATHDGVTDLASFVLQDPTLQPTGVVRGEKASHL